METIRSRFEQVQHDLTVLGISLSVTPFKHCADCRPQRYAPTELNYGRFAVGSDTNCSCSDTDLLTWAWEGDLLFITCWDADPTPNTWCISCGTEHLSLKECSLTMLYAPHDYYDWTPFGLKALFQDNVTRLTLSLDSVQTLENVQDTFLQHGFMVEVDTYTSLSLSVIL